MILETALYDSLNMVAAVTLDIQTLQIERFCCGFALRCRIILRWKFKDKEGE